MSMNIWITFATRVILEGRDGKLRPNLKRLLLGVGALAYLAAESSFLLEVVDGRSNRFPVALFDDSFDVVGRYRPQCRDVFWSREREIPSGRPAIVAGILHERFTIETVAGGQVGELVGGHLA